MHLHHFNSCFVTSKESKVTHPYILRSKNKFFHTFRLLANTIVSDYIISRSQTIFSFDIRKVTFTKLPPAPLENGQKLSMVSLTLPDGKKLQFQSLSPEIDIEAVMKGQL